MREYFQREVTERDACALDEGAWIGFGHWDAEELAGGFEDVGFGAWVRLVGGFGVGVEVADEVFEVVVVNGGFEAEFVF